MPTAAKGPLSSKNPAAVARKMYAGQGMVGSAGGHVEVMCPLLNVDGSMCRKKCVGNFAYRSICEHIRRAHPDNWIPKLPASPETFAKMVNLPSRAAITVGAQFHLRKPQQHAPAALAVYRKTGKSLKREDEQYIEGMSPSSSANESETLPSISLSTTTASFQSKFLPPPPPPAISDYEGHEDEDGHDYMEEEVLEGEMRSRRGDGDMDTEDDSDDGRHPHHRHQLLHHHHHHHRRHIAPHPPPLRPAKPLATLAALKRKRPSYAASNPDMSGGATDNSSTQSSAASRWDELIEAATNPAVAIDRPLFHHSHHPHHHIPQTPLSPPTTASSSSCQSVAPTASPPSTSSSSEFAMSTPRKLVCATCEGATPVHMAFACTECMSGFCDECAFGAGRRGSCGECRAVGGKFKPLRIVVR